MPVFGAKNRTELDPKTLLSMPKRLHKSSATVENSDNDQISSSRLSSNTSGDAQDSDSCSGSITSTSTSSIDGTSGSETEETLVGSSNAAAVASLRPKKGQEQKRAGKRESQVDMGHVGIYFEQLFRSTTTKWNDYYQFRKITYDIAIFLASENRKTDVKKKIRQKTFMKLDRYEPFDTWKAQLLV
jgi:hypothetical protein